jgi:predicted RNA-binding Zn ribbon-like protein
MSSRTERPEPGERDPAPDAALHLLQDFVNTNDIEGRRDALGTPELLGRWLADHGLSEAGKRISKAEQMRTLDVREGLRALGRANNGEPLLQNRIAALNRAAKRIPLVVGVQLYDWSLKPAARGLDGFLGTMLATVARSMADGSWPRIKACRNDTCRWLFYDQSRNRSGTWCTMAICGSRAKSRAYRSRRRAESVVRPTQVKESASGAYP